MSRRAISIMGLALVASGVPALGVEGRIPVFGPTTISEPGSYILTQDFSETSGNSITIAASDVTLDLNGHTITHSGSSPSDVNVFLSTGSTRLSIRNGRLLGGRHGILTEPGTSEVEITIEGIEVANASGIGILIHGARLIEIDSSIVRNNVGGITVYPLQASPATGRIVDSVVDSSSSGIDMRYCRQVEIRHNSITSRYDIGLRLSECPGSLIEGNRIWASAGGAGNFGMAVSGVSTLIKGNTVRAFSYGIQSATDDNRIVGNQIQSLLQGINVVGQRNLIEDNHVTGGQCGIYFSPNGGNNNAHRNNMLRGNTGAVCGAANTDAGGNIF